MFNFQLSQINQNKINQLAELLLKQPMFYSTSKLYVRKLHSLLHLPLKLDAVFKNEREIKVPIHLQDKVNRFLDILEHYEIITPVNKEEQLKSNPFINPIIFLLKGERCFHSR